MDNAPQECTSGQDDRLGGNVGTICKSDPADAFAGHQEVRDLALNNCQIRHLRKFCLHHGPIDLTVGLGARALHCWTLAAVQKPELDTCLIGNARHHPVHGIYLADKVTFPKPANGRIAGHHANTCACQRHESCSGAHPRSSMRGLRTRVATTDNDHIELRLFHVKHSYFPTQKLEKISSSKFSTSTRPTRDSRARMACLNSSAARSYISGPTARCCSASFNEATARKMATL